MVIVEVFLKVFKDSRSSSDEAKAKGLDKFLWEGLLWGGLEQTGQERWKQLQAACALASNPQDMKQ